MDPVTYYNLYTIPTTSSIHNYYTFQKVLYNGPLSSVSLYTFNNIEVVIKSIPFSNSNKLAKTLLEIQMHKTFSSISDLDIPKYICHFVHTNSPNHHFMSIVMEYIPGITLLDYCKNLENGGQQIKTDMFMKFALGIMKNLFILHAHNYSHRDIKLDNLIWTGERLVLLDFGFSCNTRQNVQITEHVELGCFDNFGFTYSYKAPELSFEKNDLMNLEIYDGNYDVFKKSDIWAAGIVFYTLLELNYPDMTTSFSTSYPNFNIIIKLMLTPDYKRRCDSETIYNLLSKISNSHSISV